MAEEKKRIVIASVLKPVNDTRMFGKIATTLASTNKYDIHVIGFPAESQPSDKITFHSTDYVDRLSLTRLLIPWSILNKIKKLQPSLLVITTHELLTVALFSKFLTGCKVVYDIQENYFANIFYTKTFPFGIRHVLAVYVRLKELITSIFIDHFFLAERGYERELNFTRSRFTILENKARRLQNTRTRIPDKRHITLLFTGTLAETTGVFTAIDLAVALHQKDRKIRLVIAGYAPKKDIQEKILRATSPYNFISLVGVKELIPHARIVEHILTSDFGIIAYPPNTSTSGSIPTKLYEYLGYQLPILLIDHDPWKKLCAPFNAAIPFSPFSADVEKLYHAMLSMKFYNVQPSGVYWEEEEVRLVKVISSLI